MRRGDVPQIARLCYDTVHRINARDYRPEQIRAWAPRVRTDAWWRRRFRDGEVLVAVEGGAVRGFAELGRDGRLDCFYVHHARQGAGTGRMLMAGVAARARTRGARRLVAAVSLTAHGFFRRMGFCTVRRRIGHCRGRPFRQFLMARPLGPGTSFRLTRPRRAA